MKILFALSSPEYLRFYDSTIRELAGRGHHVVLAANEIREGKPVRFDDVAGQHARITVAGVIPARDDMWTELARSIRGTMDFVRYLHPALASAHVLRARMKRQALPWTLQWIDGMQALAPARLRGVMRALAGIERAIPPARTLTRYLDALDPDLVVVSPLIEAASDQVDLVKAAQARGTRVAVAIASWDNLTNKGDLRIPTDLVIVWNEAQKREAVELHRARPDTVAVTGSQVFDRWFGREPSRSRQTFCRELGLPPDRPFVLFVGSSIFISRAEVEMPFVRRWIEALRASADPAVRDLAVLVRPHPYNGSAWRPEVLADMPGVVVWPRGGYNPVDEENRAGFFDSIHHSAAVVGINTSAMIEAAVVGRPVLSIVTADFARTQEGTLHFHHLLPENGGFVRVASSLEDHVTQLAAVLQDPASVRAEIDRFVASFVRPQGIDRPSTPIVAETIERYATSPASSPARPGPVSLVLRLAALPLALVAGRLLTAPARKKKLTRRARESGGRAAGVRRLLGVSSK